MSCWWVVLCWQDRVSQTCCILAAGLGCDPRLSIKAKCQQHVRLPAAVPSCVPDETSFWSTALCYIKVLMAARSSLNCCKHPCQWTGSRLRQSVGKLLRWGGGELSHPSLAHCQCQAAEATGWYTDVRMEGRGREQEGFECGKQDSFTKKQHFFYVEDQHRCMRLVQI